LSFDYYYAITDLRDIVATKSMGTFMKSNC